MSWRRRRESRGGRGRGRGGGVGGAGVGCGEGVGGAMGVGGWVTGRTTPDTVLTIQACCRRPGLAPEKLALERNRTRVPSAEIVGLVQPSLAETNSRREDPSPGLMRTRLGDVVAVWYTTMLAESS